MHEVQHLAIGWMLWLENPFHLMLFMASVHELRVIRHHAGEVHLIGFNEQGLDLMTWFATAYCACTVAWLNRGNDFFLVVALLCVLVLMRGMVLLHRLQSGQRYIAYNYVSIAERITYALAILLIGSVAFVL